MAGCAIGDVIRRERLAAGRRQRWLAQRIDVSTSALSRYELGLTNPDDAVLRAIDGVLGLGGSLVGLTSLFIRKFHGPGAASHQHRVPMMWTGPVWLTIDRATQTSESATETPSLGPSDGILRLRWGPWARDISVADRPDRVTLTFQISRVRNDDDSPPVRLESPWPTHVHWGEGRPPRSLDPVDVSEGWYPFEAGDLLRTAGALLHDALASVGRTPRELADWLGVSVEIVDSLLRGVPLSSRLMPAADGRPSIRRL